MQANWKDLCLMWSIHSRPMVNGHFKGGEFPLAIPMPDALFMGSLITFIECLGNVLALRSIEKIWEPVFDAVISQQRGCFKRSPSSRSDVIAYDDKMQSIMHLRTIERVRRWIIANTWCSGNKDVLGHGYVPTRENWCIELQLMQLSTSQLM